MRYLTASFIYSYWTFNNILYLFFLSKCPNQWNAYRCICWYVINKMVKHPEKLFARFRMISKLLSTFLPPCHREDVVRYLTASGLQPVWQETDVGHHGCYIWSSRCHAFSSTIYASAMTSNIAFIFVHFAYAYHDTVVTQYANERRCWHFSTISPRY